MGIGNTVKHMFKEDMHPEASPEKTGGAEATRSLSGTSHSNDPSRTQSTTRTSHKLPAGTGPGTSGKLPSEIEMERDMERSRSQGIAGYGTDAAAAAGGSLTETHQGAPISSGHHRASSAGRDTRSAGLGSTAADTATTSGKALGGSRSAATVPISQTTATSMTTSTTRPAELLGQESGRSAVLDEQHGFGHSARDIMPSGETAEDTSQLNPITHEHVRHLETEEVQRVKNRERHIHHVQHHTQPVVAHEELPAQHREFVHPVTRIQEQHANKAQDRSLFEGQVRQHRDTLDHAAKERTVVDKGTVVNEHIHHHIHHVIQPVIEKEVIDRQNIHTTIPIHEITHEAPVVHQSQTHAPVDLKHFLDRGGALHGGVSHDEIGKRVLHVGRCTRDVDGIAENLERDLHLGKQTTGETGGLDTDIGAPDTGKQEYTTTKVTQRTTFPEPDVLQVPPTSHN